MNTTQMVISIATIVLLVIAFGIWLAWQIKKKGLKQFAIDTIVEAEKQFNKGENQEKLNFVIDKIIATFLPAPLSVFITRNLIKNFVQKIFDQIKIALDYRESEVK